MKKTIFTILLCATSLVLVAQDKPGVGIGTKRVNKAAMLDIQANNKGVLLPRMSLTPSTTLEGGTNPTGVIVYNNGTEMTAGFYYWDGSKWELLTGDSYVSNQLLELETKWEEQINTIINGGNTEGTDVSYLVSFNPETNQYSYLKPNAEGGYDKIDLDLTAIETNTFFKTESKRVNVGTADEKDVLAAYIYFSEDVIKAWKINNPTTPIEDIDNGLGTKIDVLGIATEGFGDIVQNETNIKILQEIVQNTPNNVWIEVREGEGEFLVYYDSDNQKQEINLTQHETQTSIGKHIVTENGVGGALQSTETLVVGNLKEGDIYYSYLGEHEKIFYINMTEDVITSVQNSAMLKKEIFNTINNYSSTGGNVFYGKIDANSTEDVLYIIVDDQPQPIDISQDILKVIEDVTNNTIIEKIMNRLEVLVNVDEVDVPVGTTIDGSKVYKGKRSVNVSNNDGYDIEFDSPITLNPAVKTSDAERATYKPTNEKIESLLSVTIINKTTKQVVLNQVTDVVINSSSNQVTFNFGMGNMYTPLENSNYEVIFEYTAK
ncbi:hypothetical protein ACKUSY_17295 [Myroides odoratus]